MSTTSASRSRFLRPSDGMKVVIDGRLNFPDDAGDSASAERIELRGGPFFHEPPWPGLVTSNDLVFAPDWMHGSNAHFLFPRMVVPSEIAEAVTNEKTALKLEEWLNFDIASDYPDYQGAICLLAPNPLFRTIDKSHIEQRGPGIEESAAFKIVRRAGQRLNGLRLEVVNERLRGRMAAMVHEFADEAIVQFDFPAEIYKLGQSVTHPDYGLLSWHDPCPLLRKINVRTEIPRRRKNVRVPAGGRRWPEYEFAVDEVENAGDLAIGDAIDDNGVISRLVAAENRRSRRRAAEETRSEMVLRNAGRCGSICKKKNRRCAKEYSYCRSVFFLYRSYSVRPCDAPV